MDLPLVYFVKKRWGEGKRNSSFTVSGRLIIDDVIDLMQVRPKCQTRMRYHVRFAVTQSCSCEIFQLLLFAGIFT